MVAHWNSWLPAVIYLKDSVKYPLQVHLRQIVIQNILEEEMATSFQAKMLEAMGSDVDDYITIEKIKYATLFASLLPMLIIYPFLQKYFMKGLMIGALKG
jgi:putative aldouronate transport system permease protein